MDAVWIGNYFEHTYIKKMQSKRPRFSVLAVGLLLCAQASINLARATEAAPDAVAAPLSALHLDISSGRLDAMWIGSAPGMLNKDIKINAFIQNPEKHAFLINMVEQSVTGREFELNVHGSELELSVRLPSQERAATLHQDDTGVTFTTTNGKIQTPIHTKTFRELVRKNTGEVQGQLLRPLADMGITLDLAPDLPVVMALASSGYSDPDAATLEKITPLIADLKSDGAETHDKAVGALTRLYPLAIRYIDTLSRTSEDTAIKSGLLAVIAAHPGIQRMRPFVEKSGLQNDRKYLQGIVDEVPLLSNTAKMRLAELAKLDGTNR